MSVQRLTDLEAIHTLQARYCRYVDSGYASAGDDPDAFAALFAEDGLWAVGGPIAGREAIRAHAEAGRRFRFHLAANPIVDLDGDRATGRWHVLVALTSHDREAQWLAGRYVNEFVRTDDGWRFAVVRFERAFHAPYLAGWAAAQ